MRLLLVRHGETNWNLTGRYQGRADVALCSEGVATARRVAERLTGTAFAFLVASPLQRAGSTAAVIAEALGGLSPVVDSRLTEIDFGEWQGLTQEQVKARWPQLLRRWKRTPERVRFPGGESLNDALERLYDFLQGPPWTRFSGSGDILAVSHGGTIRLARLIAEGRSLKDFREIAVEPGAVHAFEWYAGGSLRGTS